MARQDFEKFVITYIEKMTPGSNNKQLYETLFASMNNEAFAEFVENLRTRKTRLAIIDSSLSGGVLSIERNLEIAEELGHEFFEQLWIEGEGDTPTYLTPEKALVVDCPQRRASQLLYKKISIPEHTKSVDLLTGQPAGDSAGSKISYPEVQVMASLGLPSSIIEFHKYRGGDKKGFVAMNAMLGRYGIANINTLAQFASGVESTRTFSTFLTCMHLANTLTDTSPMAMS